MFFRACPGFQAPTGLGEVEMRPCIRWICFQTGFQYLASLRKLFALQEISPFRQLLVVGMGGLRGHGVREHSRMHEETQQGQQRQPLSHGNFPPDCDCHHGFDRFYRHSAQAAV